MSITLSFLAGGLQVLQSLVSVDQLKTSLKCSGCWLNNASVYAVIQCLFGVHHQVSMNR